MGKQPWESGGAQAGDHRGAGGRGLPLDPIAEELGKDLDPFDLVCHVAFDRPPVTRRERAENVKKRDVFEDAYYYMKSG